MVIASSKYSVAPERNGNVELVRDPVPRTETGNRMYCPRCETTLSVSYEESLCMVCGYADYDYVSPNAKNGHQSMISSGTRYVLRYVGDFPFWRDPDSRQAQASSEPGCIRCHLPLLQWGHGAVILSGKRREMREERYRCTDGHRVSLTPTPSGALGWK